MSVRPQAVHDHVIFDLDGTLLDSMSDHARAFGEILEAAFGCDPARSRAFYLATAGQPLDRQFRSALGLPGYQAVLDDGTVARLIERFWKAVLEKPPALFPDTLSGLTALRRAGFKAAVSSGCSPETVRIKLAASGLSELLEAALGSDYATPDLRKGEAHFAILRARFGLDPRSFRLRTAFVGDAPHDIELARASGLLAVGRLNGSNASALLAAQPDLLATDLRDLPRLLRGVT